MGSAEVLSTAVLSSKRCSQDPPDDAREDAPEHHGLGAGSHSGHISLSLYIYIHIYIYIYTHIHTHICIYVIIYVCIDSGQEVSVVVKVRAWPGGKEQIRQAVTGGLLQWEEGSLAGGDRGLDESPEEGSSA